MLKPTSSYRMSSMTKMMLATISDPVKRSEWKRSMVQAELAAAIVIKTPTRDRNAPRGNGPTGYVTNDTGTASTAQ
jgi:hypothetical protein